MLDTLLALILIATILISGVRRIKLLVQGFTVQSLAIALSCLYFGYQSHEYHFYALALLTLISKAIIIPYILYTSIREFKIKREMELIINSNWSYILSGIGVVFIYGMLRNVDLPFLKAGVVLMIVGSMLVIGRKKAITQMIGFLVIENGLVLFEISIVKMSLIIEAGIILEVLVLALIMGIMIYFINRTFDTTNTDYLTNLKE